MKAWVAAVVVLGVVASGSTAVAQEEIPLRSTGMSLGGPTSRRVGGFRIGDVVWFHDPGSADGWSQGVVVRSVTSLVSDLKTNSSHSRQVLFDVLVPPKVAGGESMVYGVNTNGVWTRRDPISEYIPWLQGELANEMRAQMASGIHARAQAAKAGKRLSELDAKTMKLTDRYTTGSGALRLAGEVAIAVAVDRASKGLPKQYKNMSHGESAFVNKLASAGIEATGGALREVLKDPSEEGGKEAAKTFALTAGAKTSFGPLVEQMVQSKQLTEKQGERALAALQGLVNVGVAAGTAKDGKGLEAAQRQALDELYEAGLPPGVGILARDATNMGFAILDYKVVTADLQMAGLNLDVALDHGNRAANNRSALMHIGDLDRLMQIRAGVLQPAALAPTAPASPAGNNVARNAETRPLAAGAPASRSTPGHAGVAR